MGGGRLQVYLKSRTTASKLRAIKREAQLMQYMLKKWCSPPECWSRSPFGSQYGPQKALCIRLGSFSAVARGSNIRLGPCSRHTEI